MEAGEGPGTGDVDVLPPIACGNIVETASIWRFDSICWDIATVAGRVSEDAVIIAADCPEVNNGLSSKSFTGDMPSILGGGNTFGGRFGSGTWESMLCRSALDVASELSRIPFKH